jgi:uncharacterized protein YhfF
MVDTTPGGSAADMWAAYTGATGATGPYAAWGFGDETHPALMTELGLLVRDGPKRATTSRRDGFNDVEPMPRPGDHSVILDGEGRALCIIRTTAVEVRRFGDVDAAFAWAEAEGDRSLAEWRAGHTWFFESVGAPVDDATEMVLERFAKVWPPPVDPPGG